MLTNLDVVVGDAAQRVAVIFARKILVSRRRPRWRGNLKHKAFPGIIPRKHPLRMRPGLVTKWLAVTCEEIRIIVKLVVPDHVVIGAIVDLIERRPHRILQRVSYAGV